jgi:hypothetical protein
MQLIHLNKFPNQFVGPILTPDFQYAQWHNSRQVLRR